MQRRTANSGDSIAEADAFAGRAGLLIAATTVLSGVATGLTAAKGQPVSTPFLWAIAVAAVTGVAVQLLARLTPGPRPTQLATWGALGVDTDLLSAKLLALEANGRALVRTRARILIGGGNSHRSRDPRNWEQGLGR